VHVLKATILRPSCDAKSGFGGLHQMAERIQKHKERGYSPRSSDYL
jgi:hypothetical protein